MNLLVFLGFMAAAAPAAGGTGVSMADTIPRPDTIPRLDTIPRPDTAVAVDTIGVAEEPGPPRTLFGLGDEDGDLAFRIRARGEFGGDWTQFRPCDASFQVTCNPGLIPQLQPDLLLGIEAAGSVADRIFVDVDYDQTRQFAGANRFHIYYQGRDDELLQRVEVGDVTLALPETRFLTRGVPAGNFGVLARAQVAGVQLQTVFAQQQGARRSRDFRLSRLGDGAVGVIQEDTLVVDDADYVKGQFFFVTDPGAFPGAPHVDVLGLRPGDAPPEVAPGPEPVQLYRMERDPVLRQQVEGYIRADAVAEGEEGTLRESGWFRHLRPGVDYYMHPSGLWVALRSPLQPDEALAVSYINARGDSIGDYNPEAAATRGEVPTLRLLRSTRPQHQPGRPTWDLEMKQVYRISGSDEVDLGQVEMTISLGEESGGRTFKEGAAGRRIPFLRLFGMDEEAPFDRLDRQGLFQPRHETGEQAGIQGTFLVFPTLRPFMEPPPVPSEGLSAEQTLAILGTDRNRRIYELEDPLERDASGLFRLNLDVELRSRGITSTVVLGSFGIREGSERVFLGDQLLRPNLEYLIDYQSGVITLLQPEGLLARGASDRLRISWEEATVFRAAPASVVGADLQIPVGDAGSLDFMGLYQLEREMVNRPRFGAEPGALGMVGMRSGLAWDMPGLDAFLDRLPGSRGETPSGLRVDGEVAFSLPEPNLSGDAYLDDFNAGDERTISVLSTAWHLGSRPEYRDGAEHRLPAMPGVENAASLVWQHTWMEQDVVGDSVGVFDGFLSQDQIDRQIRFAGAQTRESGLRVSFGRDTTEPWEGSRWRSITTLLSPSGLDLTQTEFLDVYVADGEALTLIFDLGRVSEDAFFVDEAGRTSGTRSETGEPWGLGTLDQEADPLKGEIWSPEADARGLWPESCRAEPGRVYPVGDPRANCTRGNGRRDSEDLNQNGVLDTEERYRRYVLELDGSSPYLVRDRQETGTDFRLYRIPLRGAGAINPGGAFTEADWRSVQFLRMTVAGTAPGELTLARMRLVGSRWVKRNVEGVLRGIVGDTLALAGSLEVTPVSTLSEGGAYQAPPGVLEQLDDPTSALAGRGVEFGEKSLALRYQGLGDGDRSEVYLRFLQRPRNFLNYSDLRVWAVARRGQWGAAGSTDFFVKVGSDPENFYLYRSSLDPAANPDGVMPEDWLPEHRVRFQEWIDLRSRAEEELLRNPPRPDDPPIQVWSADSTYAVVLRDRARAPNLAAVREVSMGVWNRGIVPTTGELWLNELRLGGGVRTAGSAQVLNMELDGGNLFQARMGFTGQGAHFRQMDEMATYQTDGALSFAGTLQAGAMLPEDWAVQLPIAVSHHRTARDPFFLMGTDLQGERLPGLRTPGFDETRVSMALSADGETGVGVVDRVLPGLDLRLAVGRASGTTVTSETRDRGVEAGAAYTLRPEERTVGLLPGMLEPVARVLLPASWVRALRDTRLQWTPEEVRVGTAVRERERRTTRYNEILSTPLDLGFTEVTSESWLDNSLRVRLQPLTDLVASVELSSTRDVLDPTRGVRDPRVRPAVEAERLRLFGQDLGWETGRMVEGRFTYRPPLPPWLRADLGLQTRYRSNRSAGLVRIHGDTLPELLRNAGGERDMRANFTLEPSQLLGNGPAGGGDPDGLRRLATVLSPVSVTLQNGITSWFYREPVAPGAGFQLGLGRMGAFAEQDGVRASTLVDRKGLTLGSGLRFGTGPFLNVNYQDTDVVTLDRRAERASRVRSWPDLRAGVAEVPLPEDWAGWVERVSFSSGWQRVRDDVTFGEATLQRRSRDELRVPMEMVIVWGGGVTTRYRGLVAVGDGSDPTGTTERSRVEHGVSIETRFTPRGGLGDRIQEPLRLSLLLNWVELEECRVLVGGDRCVPFQDQLERGANLALGTRVGEMEVGGQFALVDRRSFTGMQQGFTQFQLGLWARMVFEAGPLGLLGTGMDPF